MNASRALVACVAAIGSIGGVAACSSPDYGVAPTPAGSPSGAPSVRDAGAPLPQHLGPRPQYGPTTLQADPPPPLSGGTLIVAKDGRTAVAADPDRDAVYVVDLSTRKATTIALDRRDEPGRLAEDGAGRVHVATRSGGALVTIDLASKTVVDRRQVCVEPRGVAYDPADDGVYVACASGEVVELPAAGGPATRALSLGRDLRDVVVRPDEILVSRFRAADVLHVAKASWTRMVETDQPPPSAEGASASVAWRMIALPGADGVAIVHQRGQNRQPIPISQGGYAGSGSDCHRSIVESAVTEVLPGIGVVSSPALSGGVLPVDVAISGAGEIAVVAAGNAKTPGMQQVLLFTAENPLLPASRAGDPPPDPPEGCAFSDRLAQPRGEAVAVAFDGQGFLVVQTREPAALFMPDFDLTIPLSEASREDTGHLVFHADTGAAIACASCHAEGGDDGRVWTFDGVGARRTPSLRGTVAGTAPYHWGGEMQDFAMLVREVFNGRMSGPSLADDQRDALAAWVSAIPAPRAPPPRDPAAAARGEALFEGPAGCSGCHFGPKLTSGATVDVGTGGAFQVPPLVGVAYRAPFLHAGCAATLRDRFACGGARHGDVASLDAGQIDDLVAYLETL